jgi:GntR family transcriptional regulator/MocR family aminotransferase
LRIVSLSDYLLLRINRSAGAQGATRIPVNRQIYQLIREAILAQTLPVGLQLPSSRDLARELGASRKP